MIDQAGVKQIDKNGYIDIKQIYKDCFIKSLKNLQKPWKQKF